MTEHRDLIAYLATLFALVAIVLSGLLVASYNPAIIGKIEVFGFGTITGGLIGVLRIPSARAKAP